MSKPASSDISGPVTTGDQGVVGAAHTPGPWVAPPPIFGRQSVRQDPSNWNGRGFQLICTLPSSPKGTHYGEMFKANARLIAAAPDLHSLASSFSVAVDDQWVVLTFDGREVCVLNKNSKSARALIDLGKARDAALTKAEGR